MANRRRNGLSGPLDGYKPVRSPHRRTAWKQKPRPSIGTPWPGARQSRIRLGAPNRQPGTNVPASPGGDKGHFSKLPRAGLRVFTVNEYEKHTNSNLVI